MKLSKKQREAVYAMFGGCCAYCAHALPEKRWHADHVKAVMRDWWSKVKHDRWVKDGRIGKEPVIGGVQFPENDCLDNIFPACIACNIEKGASSVEDFRHGLERKVEVLRNNYPTFRHAERFGLVAQVKISVVFYFETYQVKETTNAK